MTRTAIALLALSSVLALPAAADKSILTLPVEGEIPGWERTDVSRTYTGEELFGYINGGSDIFHELGFNALVVQEYRKRDAGFVVEAYEMSDPVAAEAIYRFKGGADRTTREFPARHTIDRFRLQFQRERFYVIINSVTGDEELIPDLLALGRRIAKQLPDAPDHGLEALLPEGWVPGTFRLLRGPIGLQSQVILGHGDLLGWGDADMTAVAADYLDSGEHRIGRVAAFYPTATDATAALERVREHLDEYLTTVSHSAHHLLFEDWQQRYGLITVSGRLLEMSLNWPAPPPVPETEIEDSYEPHVPEEDDPLQADSPAPLS